MTTYDALCAQAKNGYDCVDGQERIEMEAYCRRYMDFLRVAKTERTTITESIRLAEEQGFQPLAPGKPLKAGDRVYLNNRNHSMALAVIGNTPLCDGCSIVASHVDSPRLDLKPNPLYEKDEMAFFKTHYYGWIRKYQWFSLPLMLLGTVYLKNGDAVEISIGDQPEDPRLVIPDLLPHISDEQNKLPLNQAHSGEQCNVLLGSMPLDDVESSRAVKVNILKMLNEKYGMTEEDFVCAELEIIPALPVSEVGLDRSFIGAYGQDDRVCGYAALDALLHMSTPNKTAVLIFADKEEVGNNGITGMRSSAFDYFLEQLCNVQNCPLSTCYRNSFCFSADVTAAYDPNFADCFDPTSAARVNHGIAICKYTGFKGKEQASDACAELMAYARKLFNANGVVWQANEMGRQDLGGGGTVALEIANRGIDTLDAGVPVLGMHSPFEITAKMDCYMSHKAYKALYEE